ncbi:RNA-binding protein 7 [Trichomycterus rosablanca]|uniref:RNA-binding protein 7 n=1 Tax=Trichomycterus rosablanca TaxID=2290929 RepID=UPI002F35A44A
MGIADDADRTLFVGNLDPQVTEELLFELFLQAGPLIKVKIPKDNDGKSKQFAFVNFRHEASVPYSMELLNGIRLYGRQLNIKFKTGSSHINQEGKSPANSQNPSPANTPTHRGARCDRTPEQTGSPSYSPPQNLQRSFLSPDSLQRQVLLNNMWQMQQFQQTGMFRGGSNGSWQNDASNWGNRSSSQQDNASGHYGREQGHAGNDRNRRDTRRGDFSQHDERRGNRNRDYPPERRRDGRWREY